MKKSTESISYKRVKLNVLYYKKYGSWPTAEQAAEFANQLREEYRGKQTKASSDTKKNTQAV